MEGKFYRYKMYPITRTNAGQAALNMLTRTSSGFGQEARIYMNSVDTRVGSMTSRWKKSLS
jgi:hypothetical protein